jgi:hypothetical protein
MPDTLSYLIEGEGPADAAAAKRLADYAIRKLEPAYLAMIVRPISLWKKQGRYDRSQSHKLPRKLIIQAGRKLGGEGKGSWHDIYNPKTRMMAQKMVRDAAEKEASKGVVDHTLPKKYQKGFKGYDKEPANESALANCPELWDRD